MELLKRFWQEEEALTAVEYAIMLAFLTLLVAAALAAFFGNIQQIFQNWADWFGAVPSPSPIGGGS